MADASLEKMGKLRGAFSGVIPNVPNSGSITAANSSQTTDGAASNLIMSKEAMEKYGVKPKVKLVGYIVAGCKPDEMGIGPAICYSAAFQKNRNDNG